MMPWMSLSTNQEQGSWIVCQSEAERQKSLCAPSFPQFHLLFFLFSRAHPLSHPFHNKLRGRKWPCNFEVQAKNCTLTGCCHVYFCSKLHLSSKGLSSLLTYILSRSRLLLCPALLSGYLSLCCSVSWYVYVCFSEYFYDQEERTDEEAEPTFSEDEAVSQKGLRRSQSVKISRSRVRKDVRVLLLLEPLFGSVQLACTYGVYLF